MGTRVKWQNCDSLKKMAFLYPWDVAENKIQRVGRVGEKIAIRFVALFLYVGGRGFLLCASN